MADTNFSENVIGEIFQSQNETFTLPPSRFCGEKWSNFWSYYGLIDEYAVFLICSMGCVSNIFNVIVFSQKQMHNPTNTILKALAVTDFLCVVRGLETLIIQILNRVYGEGRQSLAIVVAELVNDILSDLFHPWSIYLTLTLAIWRFIGVSNVLKSRSWLTSRSAKWAVFTAILFSSLLVPLAYVDAFVRVKNGTSSSSSDPEYEYDRDKLGDQFLFWGHGLFIKLIPCTTLAILILCLIGSLMEAQNNRSNFLHGDTYGMVDENGKRRKSEIMAEYLEKLKEQTEFDRITKMLLTVLLIFLVTETPYGIFGVMEATISLGVDDFYYQCYVPIRPFFYLSDYISSTTSFFVYLLMSDNFRHTFCAVVHRYKKRVLRCLGPRVNDPYRGTQEREKNVTTSEQSASTNTSV